MLKIGDQIPKFSVVDQDGKTVTNEDLLGSKTILFFYPKDNTPGCTAEACNLRDNYSILQKKGYKIYGVSPDSPKKHQNFIAKFDFQYPLLADPELEAIKGFGAWGEKKFMGKEYIGLLRSTFLIDESGTIEHVIDKVKTKAHTDQILELIA